MQKLRKCDVDISACIGHKVLRTRQDDSLLYVDIRYVIFPYITIFTLYDKMRSRRNFDGFGTLFHRLGSQKSEFSVLIILCRTPVYILMYKIIIIGGCIKSLIICKYAGHFYIGKHSRRLLGTNVIILPQRYMCTLQTRATRGTYLAQILSSYRYFCVWIRTCAPQSLLICLRTQKLPEYLQNKRKFYSSS